MWDKIRECGGQHQNYHVAIDFSAPLLSGRDLLTSSLPEKELVEELKVYWKKLWRERFDDKVRAEGVAVAEYEQLFVEKGTIIHATRDYKALSFKEILERHQVDNADRFIPPPPQVGGWAKFVKTHITSSRQRKSARVLLYCEDKKEKQQPKKGGRGWLHI